MSKSLYSLILMDEVIEQIDRMAMRQNMSRSGLVNQILAEYVSLMTPEKRIGNVVQTITRQMEENGELIVTETTRGGAVAVKSCLSYKYRPTIRYEVVLSREPGEELGEISMVIRTQSEALLTLMTSFFRLWKQLEDTYVAKHVGRIRYEWDGGRFVRSIPSSGPGKESGEQLGNAISSYVGMLDTLMKAYVSKGCTPNQIEKQYLSYLNCSVGIL